MSDWDKRAARKQFEKSVQEAREQRDIELEEEEKEDKSKSGSGPRRGKSKKKAAAKIPNLLEMLTALSSGDIKEFAKAIVPPVLAAAAIVTTGVFYATANEREDGQQTEQIEQNTADIPDGADGLDFTGIDQEDIVALQSLPELQADFRRTEALTSTLNDAIGNLVLQQKALEQSLVDLANVQPKLATLRADLNAAVASIPVVPTDFVTDDQLVAELVRFEDQSVTVESLTTDLAALETKVTDNQTTLSAQAAELETKVAALTTANDDLAIANADLAAAQNALNDALLDTQADLVPLEQGLIMAQTAANQAAQDVANLTTEVADLTTEIADTKADVATNLADIAAINIEVDDFKADVIGHIEESCVNGTIQLSPFNPDTLARCEGIIADPTVLVERIMTSVIPATGFNIGDVISYQLTIKNAGSTDLTGITVSDSSPVAQISNIADPSGILGGTPLSIVRDGPDYVFTYDYTVLISDLVFDALPTQITVNSNESVPHSNNLNVSGLQLAIPNWVDGFDDFTANTGVTITGSFPGSFYPWTIVDDGFIRISRFQTSSGFQHLSLGGQVSFQTGQIDISGWNGPLLLSYWLNSDGNLENGDTIELFITVDGGTEVMLWSDPLVVNRTELLDLQALGHNPTSTIQIRIAVHNNAPSGAAGADEIMRLFRLDLKASS